MLRASPKTSNGMRSHCLQRARAPGLVQPRRSLAVRAIQEPERQRAAPQAPANGMDALQQGVTSLLRRYDFVSAGVGALAVTGICVAHGQDPATALWITAASTVVALLANEFFFEEK